MTGGPVIMIGLDAFDPAIARRLARAGHLPALAELFETAARCKVRNPFGLFVGALWLSFATALRTERHGFHCWDEVEVASYRWRQTPLVAGRHPTFWKRLSDAGRRIAAIDVPHARTEGRLNGMDLIEWGCHDRHYGLSSTPASRAGELASSFGVHPALGKDPFAARNFASDDYVHRAGLYRTPREEKAFVEALRRGVAAKRRMLSSLMAEEDWDLFLAVFGESHAVGHQQWHLHDDSHPRFDRRLVKAVGGDPLLAVYRDIDAGVGELLAQADPGATVIVLMSHGMGPHYDGAHLLDRVLSRIDRHDRGPSPVRAFRDAADRILRFIPRKLRPSLNLIARIRGYTFPRVRARQRFFLEPNNFVYGGIRLNIVGREPRGCVPESEVDAVCGQLEEDLLALVNVDTGKPAVRAVHRSDHHHARSPSDTMPDLLVDWDRSTLIETVRSPKTGIVHAPYMHWRTGDHRPAGMLLARGPDMAGGTLLPAIQVEDIGPSIAARLGVDLKDVDGRVIPWLAGSRPRVDGPIPELAQGV